MVAQHIIYRLSFGRHLYNSRGRSVHFGPGARAGFHAYTYHAMLMITASTGIITTGHDAQEVTVGDVIATKAAEQRWRSPTPDITMSHIAIMSKLA